MITFGQFCHKLQERLLMGVDVFGDYVEVYKNPTPSEMTQAGKRMTYPPEELVKKYGPGPRYLGGWMTTKDLYVWDRDIAQHHDTKHEIPKLDSSAVPLYIIWFPATDTAAVSLSSYSDSGSTFIQKDGSYRNPSIGRVIQACRNHPVFKKFDHVTGYV